MGRVRSLSLGLLLTCAVTALQGQAPISPTLWITGSWKLDPSRSDSIATNPLGLGGCGPIGLVPVGVLKVRGELVRRDQLPPGTQIPGSSSNDPWAETSRPISNERIAILADNARAPGTLLVAAGPTEVSLAPDGRRAFPWSSDGKHHVEAQLAGGVLDRRARWKGETLILELADPACGATVTREFRRVDGGEVLQLKIYLGKATSGRERTYYYVRGEGSGGA